MTSRKERYRNDGTIIQIHAAGGIKRGIDGRPDRGLSALDSGLAEQLRVQRVDEIDQLVHVARNVRHHSARMQAVGGDIGAFQTTCQLESEQHIRQFGLAVHFKAAKILLVRQVVERNGLDLRVHQ